MHSSFVHFFIYFSRCLRCSICQLLGCHQSHPPGFKPDESSASTGVRDQLMRGRTELGALLRQSSRHQGAWRSFFLRSARLSTNSGGGGARQAGASSSWSTRGVLAVAGTAGVLGWGIAQVSKNGEVNGKPAAVQKPRYATVKEMEKVSPSATESHATTNTDLLCRPSRRSPSSWRTRTSSPPIQRTCTITDTQNGRQ